MAKMMAKRPETNASAAAAGRALLLFPVAADADPVADVLAATEEEMAVMLVVVGVVSQGALTGRGAAGLMFAAVQYEFTLVNKAVPVAFASLESGQRS